MVGTGERVSEIRKANVGKFINHLEDEVYIQSSAAGFTLIGRLFGLKVAVCANPNTSQDFFQFGNLLE